MTLALAVLLTIAIETVIAWAVLRRPVWLESVAIQLVTWPIAQMLLWRTGKLVPIEAGVALVETILWRVVLPLSLRRALAVSFAANAATAAIAFLFFFR